MVSKTIHIAIVSDFACPWCLVGIRRLDRAMEQRPDIDFSVVWKPFQLNPGMRREGRNRRAYYHSKFGEAGCRSLRQNLQAAVAQDGIIFCDTPEAMAPNTLSAHVLMLWATERGDIDTHALAEKLLHAHHIACENIGDHEVLTRIAADLGMDQERVSAGLVSGEDEDRVKEQVLQSMERGVAGVPFFIINDQMGITGAQSVATLVSAFDSLDTQ